ncbi:MAG: type II secretion system protein GspJ, partial [Sphingopyxis sp.]
AMLSREMMAAQPRPSHDGAAQIRPAMLGRADSVAFTHAVAQGNGQPDVERVRFRVANGALSRAATMRLDGAEPADDVPFLTDMASGTFRYRARDGQWVDEWAPADPAALPTAIEITLTGRQMPRLSMKFLVGSGAANAGLDDGSTNSGPAAQQSAR